MKRKPVTITAPNGATLTTRKASRFVEVCWSTLVTPSGDPEKRAWITHGSNELYILTRLVDAARIPVEHATFDLDRQQWHPSHH